MLRKAWLGGRTGYLTAWSEAKLWAIREVWRSQHDSEHGLQTFAATKVTKWGVTGGKKHPTPQAVGQFYDKVDSDPEWFPGKQVQEGRGPARALTGPKASVIARSAQSMKRRGAEPTYRSIVAACPAATRNPNTGQAVGKKRVYDVFRERCKDPGADQNWKHKARYSKTALSPETMAKRCAFGLHVQGMGRRAVYFYNHMVWVDICNSILPRSEIKASEQALARKGKKGWGSPGCELHSCNLRGNKEALKQNSWDTIKIWWAPILTRGKLHIEVFDQEFPGETDAGAEILVGKVRAAVNTRFQSGTPQPDTLWTDRGKGFYNTGNGRITVKYAEALREHGFGAALGEDASVQPGKLQELMLHETAVAWIRDRLSRTLPAKPWNEARDAYGKRLKRICNDINSNCEVEALCRAFPTRINTLVEREGGRLEQ